jgi:hypothetical protein
MDMFIQISDIIFIQDPEEEVVEVTIIMDTITAGEMVTGVVMVTIIMVGAMPVLVGMEVAETVDTIMGAGKIKILFSEDFNFYVFIIRKTLQN